jgi:hypothetical protein
MTREQCIEAMARAIDPDAFDYHPGIGPLASKWCEEMCQEAREQATAAYDALLPHIQAEREKDYTGILTDEIVCEIRRFAREVTGGNCAFADDDLHILSNLALRAAKAGMVEGFKPELQRKILETHALDIGGQGDGRLV